MREIMLKLINMGYLNNLLNITQHSNPHNIAQYKNA